METFLAGARVVVSLAVVLGLLWMLQRRLTRGSRRSATGRPVTIVTKQAISPKASVVIIDVEGTRLLLGVTEHAVSVLQSGDAPEPVVETAAAIDKPTGAQAFAESLSKVTTAKLTGQKVAPKKSAAQGNTAGLAPVTAFTGERQGGGALAGSIISPGTWKQMAASFRQAR